MSNVNLAQTALLTSGTDSDDSCCPLVENRKLFLRILNRHLCEDAQISVEHTLLRDDLKTIVLEKVFSFFQCYRLQPETSQQVQWIYPYDSLLIQQFFKQSLHPKARYLTAQSHFDPDFRLRIGYQHPAAKLIALLFNGKEMTLMIDIDKFVRP